MSFDFEDIENIKQDNSLFNEININFDSLRFNEIVVNNLKANFIKDLENKNRFISADLIESNDAKISSLNVLFSKDSNDADVSTQLEIKGDPLKFLKKIKSNNIITVNDQMFALLNNIDFTLENIKINFAIKNSVSTPLIESISRIQLSLESRINEKFIFDKNDNPNFIQGPIVAKLLVNFNSLTNPSYNLEGTMNLDKSKFFLRQLNLSKDKDQDLKIQFDGNYSNENNLTINISSNEKNDLFIDGSFEIFNNKKVVIYDLAINNSLNLDINISGNIFERKLDFKILGEIIDFSMNAINRKKKDKYFFESEIYDIQTNRSILEGNVLVENVDIKFNKYKENSRVKARAEAEGHTLFYLRVVDNEVETNSIKTTNIIPFLKETHPFKKIISRGDVHIESKRKAYSSKSFNEIKLNEFTLINTPAAVKLLTLPSLSGISSIIENEEGINFINGEVKYTEDLESYSDISMYAVSDSIGLSMDGNIDRLNDHMYFKGEISPMHLVNMILKKVPIIGDLLIGEEGEGLFAFEFKMKGDTNDPEVKSNPLSIAKPQILERASDYLKSIEL